MNRTPLRRKSASKRRTTSPRCTSQRCSKRAEIVGLCLSHAEQRADRAFSRDVRARDARCTASQVLTETECKGILQAAHGVGRRRYSVRYDFRNAHALCQAHHMLVDQHSREAHKRAWLVSVLGLAEYDQLMQDALASVKRRQAIEAALNRGTA